ncbi:MAG: AAA family ATPase [Candidatus Methanoperedens sp.]|nr:AAA family ATPase [Candidatus Methanoperedens sp.]
MKFIIKNFGPIKNADVILGDFNAFIGPGGTGKSYLAYLVWMLLKMEPKWETLAELPASSVFGLVLDNILDNKEISKDLSDQLLIELMETYQKAHEENVAAYLKDTFRFNNLGDIIYEDENEAIIKICNNEDTKRIEITISKSGVTINGFRELLLGEKFVIKYKKEQREIAFYNGKDERTSINLPIKYQELDVDVVIDALIDISSLASHIVLFDTVGYYSAGDQCILTDSKSGILRAATDLIRYTLVTPQKDKGFSLNLPDREMVSKLIISEKQIKDEEISKIADFIEKEIGGGIDIDTKGLLFPEIFFKKRGKNYPILRSHSGVRELAPLILYLRYVLEEEVNSLLVFEEPETHLHPYMQSVVTRALALLSKKIHVLITTHSPVILDELNNLVKLNKLTQENKKKAGYKETEGLKPESVYIYRFKLDGNVEKIKAGEDGIDEEEFSSVIIELSNKYAEVEELLSKSIYEKPKNRADFIEWKE